MRTILETVAPSSWAPLLINGDDSGMDEAGMMACEAWHQCLRALHPGLSFCVDAVDVGFITFHDARAYMPLAADCQTYTFILEGGATPPAPPTLKPWKLGDTEMERQRKGVES